MSLNQCNFMGNLGSDVALAYLPDGRAVGNFSIACTEKWKDKDSGQIKEVTEWVRIVMFGRRAEVVAKYFKKGHQIYLSGKMRTRQWEKDGVKHYITEIIADEFQFCGNAPAGGDGNKPAQQEAAYSGHPADDFD